MGSVSSIQLHEKIEGRWVFLSGSVPQECLGEEKPQSVHSWAELLIHRLSEHSPVAVQAVGIELCTSPLASRQEARGVKQAARKGG